MNRRELLRRAGLSTFGVCLGESFFPRTVAADKPKRRVLMFTKSEGYQHKVVTRVGGQLSMAETIVTEMGKKHGFDVVCTKDGRVFINEDLNKYDLFLFESQGNLYKEGVDKQPPMTFEGKRKLLDAVAAGKGFVGCHCASDTFHTAGDRFKNQLRDDFDPYIAMLGGEFIVHGLEQRSGMIVKDPSFPGLKERKDFVLNEEWYALKNFAPDLHVLLVQETNGMPDAMYRRAPYPASWARKHDKGRVFYTSMGHLESVWKNEVFQEFLLGGMQWAAGNVEVDVTPNMDKAAPGANELPVRK